MDRLSQTLLVSSIIVSVCSLSGCSVARERTPQDILTEAARRGQLTIDAQLLVEGDLRLRRPEGEWEATLNLSGLTRAAGGATELLASATLRHDTAAEQITGNIRGTISLDDDGTMLLRATSVTSDAARSPLPADWEQQLLGPGLRIGEANRVALTPHPGLLSRQIALLRITTDRGQVDLRGRPAYHYELGVDKPKLEAFLVEAGVQPEALRAMLATLDRQPPRGEVWIDVDTLRVHRLHWQLPDVTDAVLSGELRIDVLPVGLPRADQATSDSGVTSTPREAEASSRRP
jgi:hypothetical protein